MATSALASLIFILFLPCFSSSCTTTLPCGHSIQIKAPFNFQSDITKGPNCQGNLSILCSKDKPFLEWIPNPLPLENISYENKTITVQDPYLSSLLKKSGCRNLYFIFSSPINLYYGMYGLWNSSLSSVRCDPINQIQSPPKIFRKVYNLSYSPILDENHKPPPNCQNSLAPSLEYIYSFNDNGQLSLLSASYSGDLLAQPGCFANWTEVPEDGKGYLTIGCNKSTPFLLWLPKSLPLKSISYENSTITVQDPYLSSSLKKSGCHNLYFNFSSPIELYLGMYDLWNSSLSYVICDLPDHTQSLPKIFRNDYNLSYSSSLGEYDKPTQNCLRPKNSLDPSFESIFSFENDSPQLFLLSASYSDDLVARPGCYVNWTEVFDPEDGKGKKRKQATMITILIGTTVGSIAFLGACLIFYLKLQSSKKSAEYISRSKNRPEENIEMVIEKYGSFAPKRYKYAEVKKITGSFQHRLGKGGFGTVYKGILQDGRLVAVKNLHSFSYGREELLNEVLSIGRTSHVNVVSLLGFCIEGSKQALIYEYMPNGSLDNYIYSENPKAVLGWEKLYEIAIGIARGLEYLHRGCNARIVHFDIKPQNILLDEDFNPKIADFGLAKLCPPKESILSMAEMRGTIGYIAPEVFSRSFGVVSTKSDVYSYGMMVLEMVGGRRNAKPSAENPSQVYFPHWLYDCLVEGSPLQLQACDVLSMIIEEIAKKMGIVGLWCTQTTPANRPSMSKVVEMLEKSLDELKMPPKPYLCSPPHSTVLSYTPHTPKFELNSHSDSDCLIGANTL